MSSIVAVVHRDGRSAVPAEDLERLIAAHTALRGAAVVQDRTVDEWARIAVIGDALISEGAWGAVTAVGAVHARGGGPPARIEDLDGHFAAVVRDAASGAVEFATDPLGSRAVFVHHRSDRTYVTTSALILAKALGLPPDPVATNLFLSTGRIFGPRSLWLDVHRLDAGTALRFHDGHEQVRRYWQPSIDPTVRGMTFEATVDRCAEVMVAHVSSRLGDVTEVSADLTGGYDSRLVAAMLSEVGVPWTGLTAGEPDAGDVVLAERVATAAGAQWRRQALPAGWAPSMDELREALAWGDGALDVLYLAETLWRQRERTIDAHRVVTGGGGEIFGPAPWLQEFPRAARTTRVDWNRLLRMKVMPPIDLSPVVGGGEEAEAYVREVLARAAEPHRDELNTSQLDIICTYWSTGHFGAYQASAERHVRADMPCMWRDVFATAFSAHHRWRKGHRLHRALTERLSPPMSAVATGHGGPAQRMRPGNAIRFWPYYERLGRAALRKLRKPTQTGMNREHEREHASRTALRWLEDEDVFLADAMRSAGLYDHARLRTLIEEAPRPGFAHWALLGRIATLELGLREVDGAAF